MLVGGGKKRSYVEEQVRTRGLTNVRLFDFVPEEELSDLLATADINVVTLEPGMEGICVPSKFYAVLASGRATLGLMSPGSEVAMVVEEADCGYQINIGDVDGMVRMLESVGENPELLAEMGTRARAVFEEHYSADRVAKNLYLALRTCTNRA